MGGHMNPHDPWGIIKDLWVYGYPESKGGHMGVPGPVEGGYSENWQVTRFLAHFGVMRIWGIWKKGHFSLINMRLIFRTHFGAPFLGPILGPIFGVSQISLIFLKLASYFLGLGIQNSMSIRQNGKMAIFGYFFQFFQNFYNFSKFSQFFQFLANFSN